jgi:aryl-alcohol dehydrogenase-like predicted oxidoreductase
MKQRRLGPDGPLVGEVGLGGMYLSLDGRPDEAQAIRTIYAALDAGVTLIDTADVYCLDDRDRGHNERLIAKALSGRAPGIVVATKGGLRRPGGAWVHDARPEQITAACEASSKALGVAVIDLYQLHAPGPHVPFVESVGAIARLRDRGLVRLVGLSNVSVDELAAARRIVPIASVQNRWNVHDRAPERDGMLAACEAAGIAFLPYSPFGGGNRAPKLLHHPGLAAAALRRDITPHRLLLAWMLARSPVVIPIPGSRQPHNAQDSAWATGVDLSAEDVAEIAATL